MNFNSFRFNIQEFGGALADMGTLLPLMVALILINGLNPTSVLAITGLLYITSGLYYRIPIPVQPLKAVAAISISMGLSAGVIGAAGLIMGVILLVLSVTGLINRVVRFFPLPVVRGIQLSIGLILFRKGIEFVIGGQTFMSGAVPVIDLEPVMVGIILASISIAVFLFFKLYLFRKNQRLSPPIALLLLGLCAGVILAPPPSFAHLSPVQPSLFLPTRADFWVALTVLVIPQLPLTLGNAVVGTNDTAKAYFGEDAKRATPRALTTSMGIANIIAGAFAAMPMCHGSGGLTAHYKLGARTGAASVMLGAVLLTAGVFFGRGAVDIFSLIPLSVLGVLLAIVGVYHAGLVRDMFALRDVFTVMTVAVVSLTIGNLALGFGAGILLYHILRTGYAIRRRYVHVKTTV